MKKTLLITSLAAALGLSTAADAAFTPLGDGVYKMTITGGCFDFGDCLASGKGVLTDNTTSLQATISGFGSGITGDGVMGVIDFTLTSGDMAVTSYAQDSYLDTAGGTFYLQDQDSSGSLMTGTIDGAGNMSFNPTGRDGIAAKFAGSLGLQEWNRDNGSDGLGSSLYDVFTTGSVTNRTQGFAGPFTAIGLPLADLVSGEWTGQLVSVGNIGTAWGDFDMTQYSESWEIKIVLLSGVPVAVGDGVSGPVNTPIVINIAADLLANDTHATNETLSFVSFDTTSMDAGSSILDNSGVDGTLVYTPNPGLAEGPDVDQFDYTITDQDGMPTSTATVLITLTSASANAPVANDDAVDAIEDTAVVLDPVAGAGAGIAPDMDADAGQTATLAISAVDAFSANSGTVTLAAGTNNLTYTPAANFAGPTDTFNYTIRDTDGLTASAMVTVTVAAVNDAPVCLDASLVTPIGVPLTINVVNDLLITTGPTPKCTDVEGDAVSLETFDATGSNGGTLSSNGAGELTYTPAAGFEGEETFSLTATDSVTSAVANVLTIDVADSSLSNFTMISAINLVFGGTNDVEIVWDEVSFNSNADDGNGVPTDTNFGLMTIASDEPFKGPTWKAHHVRIFKNTTSAPITYKFDVTCERADYDSGNVVCNKPLVDQDALQQYIFLPLQPGEIGAHILFDWNKAKNIDVVNVWKENAPWDRLGGTGDFNKLWLFKAGVPPDPATDWRLVSTDVANDGVDNVNGSPMVDGPFLGFFANFNYKPATSGGVIEDDNSTIEEVDVDDFAFSMGWLSLLAGLLSVFGLRKRRINS